MLCHKIPTKDHFLNFYYIFNVNRFNFISRKDKNNGIYLTATANLDVLGRLEHGQADKMTGQALLNLTGLLPAEFGRLVLPEMTGF